MGHHVAPMTRRVSHRQQHRYVASLRLVERLGTPRKPVDGIVGMLLQVRAAFLGQAIHPPRVMMIACCWRVAGVLLVARWRSLRAGGSRALPRRPGAATKTGGCSGRVVRVGRTSVLPGRAGEKNLRTGLKGGGERVEYFVVPSGQRPPRTLGRSAETARSPPATGPARTERCPIGVAASIGHPRFYGVPAGISAC